MSYRPEPNSTSGGSRSARPSVTGLGVFGGGRYLGACDAARLPGLRMSLGAAAVRYAELGLPVLQLAERGKVPVGGHGLLDATADPAAVAARWRHRPRANIGIRIPDDLVVVDVDGPDGVRSVQSRGRQPRTLTAATARGWHLWFSVPDGVQLRQRAGVLPGVDTRTSRGYVVAPPSVHETGVLYDWVRLMAPAAVPAWLVDLLRVPPPATREPLPAATPSDGSRAQRYARAALSGEAAAVANTAEGGRNHRLFAAWRRCAFDPSVAAYIPREEVRETLTRAALSAGLDHAEIARTLREES